MNRTTAPPMDGRVIGPVKGGKYLAFKNVADRAIAIVLLAMAAPVIGALAIVVRLTSTGPAFYSQLRLGYLGRPFRIWKLRTMIHDCEAATGPVWARPGDTRATAIGNILRSTYLDELPQLWNVARGDMSLVGPRPERPEIIEQLESTIPGFNNRLFVKPGLTGLAQLRLRPDIDVGNIPHKLAQDLYYVHHQNLFLDIRILISTAFHLIGAGCACATCLLLGRANADTSAHPRLAWTIHANHRETNIQADLEEIDSEVRAAA